MSDDLIGEQLGQFRIVAKIGQGGMGVVYRATDEKLRRTVALKVLPAGFAAVPARRDRFLREGRAAAGITHANIATVYDVGEADGRLYIAMELVEGESLAARLGRGAMPIADALKFARGIAGGLARAHEKGLVHRDLKPDNVMMGADSEVKILDFGLAKELGSGGESGIAQAATEPAVTVEGQVLGTPAYMSPEQAAGKTVDARSDVFAFGVVLYEMVTGAAPFTAETTMELLIAIARDTPPPASTRNPAVPLDLEAVIERCLAKAPEGRYGNARELLGALERLGEVSGTSRRGDPAVGDPSVGVASRGSRSGAWISALAIVCLAALAVGGWRLRADGDAAPGLVASASAHRDAASPGVAMTDHPPPKTNVPEAALAYAKALQDMRDASISIGRAGFARAVTLDPGLAAAHVRLALFTESLNRGVDPATSYRAAHELRTQLDERDQMLLRAAEALHGQSPPDFAACEARLAEASQRFPEDAEILFYLANVETLLDSKPDDALAAAVREQALDPGSAAAVWHVAKVRMLKGDAAGALETAAHCLVLFPSATSCMRIEAFVHAAQGNCPAMLADARAQLVIEPRGRWERTKLFEALVATGASPEALVEANAQLVAITEPKDRAATEATQAFYTSALTGDFDAAARSLDDLARVSVNTSKPGEPVTPVQLWLALLQESGDPHRAGIVAKDFLKRLPSYNDPSRRAEIIDAVETLVGTGEMTREEAASRARGVIEATAPAVGTPGQMGRSSQVAEYASAVDDEPTLRAILATYADPLPSLDLPARVQDPGRTPPMARGLGKALVVTGDVERGVPLLEQASRACDLSANVFGYVRSLYWLGFGHEKKGEAAEACKAYARVLGYWGRARPLSVTADKARARMKGLGCRD